MDLFWAPKEDLPVCETNLYLSYSLTGPAGLVKYFNTRTAVQTLDQVSVKVT